MTTPDFIIVAVLVLPFGLLFQGFVLRYILTYQLTESSVRVVLFGTVPLSTTRLNGPFVLIHRKWGLSVAISPEDPDDFMREFGRRAYQRTGEWPPVS